MARPAQSDASSKYSNLRAQSMAFSEGKDCAVVAVAAATGVKYEVAREALAAAGRKPGKGTYFAQTTEALAALGFVAVPVNLREFVDTRYPARFVAARVGVTTHHPDRFPGAFRAGETFLLRTNGHILCVRDGVNHDWTRGKAKRVALMYRVVPA